MLGTIEVQPFFQQKFKDIKHLSAKDGNYHTTWQSLSALYDWRVIRKFLYHSNGKSKNSWRKCEESLPNRRECVIIGTFLWKAQKSSYGKGEGYWADIPAWDEDRVVQKNEGIVDKIRYEVGFPRDGDYIEAEFHNKELDEK